MGVNKTNNAQLVQDVKAAMGHCPFCSQKDGVPKLEQVEKNLLMRALAFAVGDREIAAKAMGISRSKLFHKLRQYR